MKRSFERGSGIAALLLTAAALLTAAPAATAQPRNTPQLHIMAGADLPTAFGSIDRETNRTLDTRLFSGTYGTTTLGADLHLLFPVGTIFYVGGNTSYKSGLLHDYFLGTTSRYLWLVEMTGTFGVAFRPWSFLQAYAGAGIGAVALRTEGAAGAATWVGPVATVEAGADFLFLGHFAAGPRAAVSYGPMFGTRSSDYGYFTVGIQAGYSH